MFTQAHLTSVTALSHGRGRFRLQRGSRAFSIIHPNLCANGLEKNDKNVIIDCKLTGCLAESGLLLQSSPLKHASSHTLRLLRAANVAHLIFYENFPPLVHTLVAWSVEGWQEPKLIRRSPS